MSSEAQPQPPPPPPPPPGPPAQPGRGSVLAAQAFAAARSGWGRAAIVAAGVAALVYLLNIPLAWLQSEATPKLLPVDGGSIENPIAIPGIPKMALLSMMLWHGISVKGEVALPQGAIPFGVSIEVSVALTLMLGLALAGYLLYRGGRWAAEHDAALGWLVGIRGLQIALLYGVLMLLLAFLANVDVPIPQSPADDAPDSVSVGASKIGALGLGFTLALFAAGAGALSGRLRPRERPARLVIGAVSGGWRAAWLAVALASIGFLIVAAMNPDETRAYLDLAPGGALTRTLLIATTLLVVPNMGTGIAAAAMGGSINLATNTDSCAFISFLKFPGGVVQGPGLIETLACGLPVELGPAPFVYFLFLLVPLAATIAGGWLAAQRVGAREMEDGALAGAAIALTYALWLWALALFARVGATTSFFVAVSEGWVGPGLVFTILVALVWGAIGGAIGGALGARNASGPGMTPGPSREVAA